MKVKKVKGLARKVEAKDVSPAWKVLQMKLNEEKAEKERAEKEAKVALAAAAEAEGFTIVEKKPKNRQNQRKRRMQEALQEANTTEKKVKLAEDVAVFSKDKTKGQVTKVLAIDCEYVGGGKDGMTDILARVSIVNQEGEVVYDKYVKPRDAVTDYRTAVSGIRPANLQNAYPFQKVQFEVAALLKDKIVVGHAVHNDFRVLCLTHTSKNTRDTSRCALLKELAKYPGSRPASLKHLASAVLGIDIQQGEHDSVVDARVTLRLYLTVKKKWEADIKRYRAQGNNRR